jgi:hypothetical protein
VFALGTSKRDVFASFKVDASTFQNQHAICPLLFRHIVCFYFCCRGYYRCDSR